MCTLVNISKVTRKHKVSHLPLGRLQKMLQRHEQCSLMKEQVDRQMPRSIQCRHETTDQTKELEIIRLLISASQL